jgi:acyl-CoA synthetase (AMP-forming)/AMP-acid ligase II
VQLRPGATLTGEELAEHVRANLASYKAPRELVIVDAVVRSPSGKPDYRWARATAEREIARPSAPR